MVKSRTLLSNVPPEYLVPSEPGAKLECIFFSDYCNDADLRCDGFKVVWMTPRFRASMSSIAPPPLRDQG